MKKIAGIAELHGKPKKVVFKNFSFVVVPIYHPAAMLIDHNLEKLLQKIFNVMKKNNW